MEHPRAQLLPTTCLSRFAGRQYQPADGYRGDFLHQCSGARVGHGVHHAEVQGLWVLLHDVADSHHGDTAFAVGPGAAVAEQHHVLDLHDHGIKLGKSS